MKKKLSIIFTTIVVIVILAVVLFFVFKYFKNYSSKKENSSSKFSNKDKVKINLNNQNLLTDTYYNYEVNKHKELKNGYTITKINENEREIKFNIKDKRHGIMELCFLNDNNLDLKDEKADIFILNNKVTYTITGKISVKNGIKIDISKTKNIKISKEFSFSIDEDESLYKSSIILNENSKDFLNEKLSLLNISLKICVVKKIENINNIKDIISNENFLDKMVSFYFYYSGNSNDSITMDEDEKYNEYIVYREGEGDETKYKSLSKYTFNAGGIYLVLKISKNIYPSCSTFNIFYDKIDIKDNYSKILIDLRDNEKDYINKKYYYENVLFLINNKSTFKFSDRQISTYRRLLYFDQIKKCYKEKLYGINEDKDLQNFIRENFLELHDIEIKTNEQENKLIIQYKENNSIDLEINPNIITHLELQLDNNLESDVEYDTEYVNKPDKYMNKLIIKYSNNYYFNKIPIYCYWCNNSHCFPSLKEVYSTGTNIVISSLFIKLLLNHFKSIKKIYLKDIEFNIEDSSLNVFTEEEINNITRLDEFYIKLNNTYIKINFNKDKINKLIQLKDIKDVTDGISRNYYTDTYQIKEISYIK